MKMSFVQEGMRFIFSQHADALAPLQQRRVVHEEVARLLASGTLSLGALAGGWLGERIGLQQTLLVGAVGLLSTWLWLVFSPVRKLRAFPPQELASLPSRKQSAMDASPTRMEEGNPIHQKI